MTFSIQIDVIKNKTKITKEKGNSGQSKRAKPTKSINPIEATQTICESPIGEKTQYKLEGRGEIGTTQKGKRRIGTRQTGRKPSQPMKPTQSEVKG